MYHARPRPRAATVAAMSGRAFVLRMNPLWVSRVEEGLASNQIGIGWGKTGPELLNLKLDRYAFAMHVHRVYYPTQQDRRRSGKTAGQLWRFIRVMSPGDLIVVPDGETLHVAEVTGEVTHNPADEHWAYRRRVRWLTGGAGRARTDANERLRSAFHNQITCFEITPLLGDVRDLAA